MHVRATGRRGEAGNSDLIRCRLAEELIVEYYE